LREGSGVEVLLQTATAVELVEGEGERVRSWFLLHWSGDGCALLVSRRRGEGVESAASVMVGAQAVFPSPDALPPAPLAEAEVAALVAAVPTAVETGCRMSL
jgi:hypothetical protein